MRRLLLTHAVVFFPAEIPNATAGLVFGFAIGLPRGLDAAARPPRPPRAALALV